MGGRQGIRGYLIQTLVCVLDSLDVSNRWVSVTIEPVDDSEKVDIAWKYDDRRRVVQVKSSQNQINHPDAKKWASDLETSTVADEYELRLLGPCSEEVALGQPIGKVQLAKPEPENVPALLERAAHKLDLFLHTKRIALPPKVREIVVEALSNRLLTDAINGQTWARSDFDDLLTGWISDIQSTELPLDDVPLPQPQNSFFCGRDEVLTRIRNDFETSDREGKFGIQVLSGLGGVGKTQIALEYAYRYRTEYSHVFFVDADTHMSICAGLADLAMQLGIQAEKTGDHKVAVDAMKRWLASHDRWLLLYDNADTPDIVSAFLIQRKTCHTLLTSRAIVFDMLGVGCPHVVAPLSPEDSESFLLARTGRKDTDGQERFAAKQIGVELDGLPLALEQAGAYITSRQMPFSTYLSAFIARRLQILSRSRPVTGAYPNTVATTWSLNIEAVKQESQASADLLRWIAFFHPNRIPLDVIVVGARDLSDSIADAVDGLFEDHDLTRIDELLFPLTRYSLITKQPVETISIHHLVQEVIQGEMDADTVRTCRRQLIKALLNRFPPVKYEVWWHCERILPHAVTILGESMEEDLLCEEAGTLLYRCAQYLDETGDYHLALSIYSKAVEVREKVLGTDNPDLGMTINNLGVTLHRLGQYADAEGQYKRALHIRRIALGECHPDVAQTYNNLGLSLVEQGKYDQAGECYRLAHSILAEAGNDHRLTLATCLNNLAGLYREKGDNAAAEELHRQILEMKLALLDGQHPSVAHTMKHLAYFVFERGEYHDAMEMLSTVMETESRTIGVRHPDYGHSLNFLGSILEKTGKHAEAISAYESAGELFFNANGGGDPGIGLVYANLASLYTDQGDFDNAYRCHMNAIQHAVACKGPEHLDAATAMHNAGVFYLRIGDGQSAKELFEDALDIRVKKLGRDHRSVATSLGNLGMIAGRACDNADAEAKFSEAFAILQRLGFPVWDDTVNLISNYLSFLQRTGDVLRTGLIYSCLDATNIISVG